MKAELITRFKGVAEDGGVMDLVVWRVPQPVPPTDHGYKYRAVQAVDGVRVVGSTTSEEKAITAICMDGALNAVRGGYIRRIWCGE